MSSILKGLNESYSRDEENQQNAMNARRSSDLNRERNAGLNEPDEFSSEPIQTRNGVYEYNVPAGQEDIAQELGLQQHRGHWISRIPIQRANFQFGRPQFHEIPSQGVAEGSIGDKIKGAAKSVKRATQGWGVGAAPDMITPKGVVQAFGDMDGQRLANFVASRKDFSKPRNNSARAFADKVIDREMRQRGYGRVAGKDEQGVAEGSTEQVYKVLAVDKSNALSKQVKLKVKASSLDEVFERLAINDWYPLEINGVEVINGKRLKQGVAEGQLDELSNNTLASYKKKAGADATQADKRGDYARGNKRMSGIIKATKKEFDNDAKGVNEEELDENLNKWFKEKWVRFGPDGKIRGDCARGDDSEGKPKCLPQSKAQNLGKEGRASAASRKRREDPNPERSGKAINVNTKKKSNESVAEGSKEKTQGIALSKAYKKDFDDKKPGQDRKETALTGTYSKTGKPGGELKKKGVAEEQLDELSCWSGYHRVAGTKAGFPGSCAKNKTNEQDVSEGVAETLPMDDAVKVLRQYGADHFKTTSNELHFYKNGRHLSVDLIFNDDATRSVSLSQLNSATRQLKDRGVTEEQHSCPHCGGEMVSEELMNEKKDACYNKVKSRYKVWPSAYASGALVQCRKKGADNWGNGGKKNEGVEEGAGFDKWADDRAASQLHKLKPGMVQDRKTGKWYDPNKEFEKKMNSPEVMAQMKRMAQKESIEEGQLDEKWTKKYKDSINCSNPKGFSQKAHCAGKQKNESAIMKGLK
jgi:hypothetical protein